MGDQINHRFPCGSGVVEVEDSGNILIRQYRTTGPDAVIHVTDVENLREMLSRALVFAELDRLDRLDLPPI